VQVEVRVFGGLTERVGGPRVTLVLPDNATVADLRPAVAAEHPAIAPLLGSAVVAVDLEVVGDEHPLAGAHEIALLPPVAGGSSDRSPPASATQPAPILLTGLRDTTLAVEPTLTAIRTPQTGATAVFLGTVRDHTPEVGGVVGLDYTAYEAMAERVLATLAETIVVDHPRIQGLALLHAIGALPVGAPTILIACTAAHRQPAFAACEDALERVKEQVPVFKRERYEDGTHHWVGLPGPAGLDPDDRPTPGAPSHDRGASP